LEFSEINGNDTSSEVNILVNLFDFDTRLTRYDIFRLKSNTHNWENRLEEIDSISDSAKRDSEYKRVIEDMMADSSKKKNYQKVIYFW